MSGEYRNRRKYRVLAGLYVCAWTAACGMGDGAQGLEGALFEEWDSAEIRIAESSHEALEVVLPWVVDTVPSLELGRVEGEGPYQFHRIRGMTGFSDGGLAVVDGGSQEIRWFDDAGEYRFGMGGAGEGPGEFGIPVLLQQVLQDSLLIFDTRMRRFTRVAKDGSGYRVYEPPQIDRYLIGGSPLAADRSRLLVRSPPLFCLDYCEGEVFIFWVHLTRGTADTLGAFPTQSVRTTEIADVPYIIRGPFDPVVLAAVGFEGPVVGSGVRLELRQFDASGQLKGIFRIDAPLPDATDEALEQVVQRWVEDGADSKVMSELFARMYMPRAMPPFQALLVDRTGWYWAELFRLDQDDASVWVVFDPRGQAHGVIELPENLEVYEIGKDYVLGRSVDDLGVEYVRRYDLWRGDGGSGG